MQVCTKCHVEYEEEKGSCPHCGGPLAPGDQLPQSQQPAGLPDEDRPKVTLLCPICDVRYSRGTYCRKCGGLLVQESLSLEKDEHQTLAPQGAKVEAAEARPLEKEYIKKLSGQLSRLYREKRRFEALITDLEEQRDTLSSDAFKAKFDQYHVQLEDISTQCEALDMEVKSVGKRAFEEIDRLARELKPIQQKLEALPSLSRSEEINKSDFSKEKKELESQIQSKEKEIKNYQQMISLLSHRSEGGIGSHETVKSLFRPLLFAGAGLIILIATAGYLMWPSSSYFLRKEFPSGGRISTEVASEPSQAPQPTPLPPPAQEAEKIRSLLEKIKEANLKEDIDLFMSCYALDFKEREGKRVSALENWKDFDYVDLSYQLKRQTISGETATARVEWRMKVSGKNGGPAEESRSVLDVTFKREQGDWKIKEVKPVG